MPSFRNRRATGEPAADQPIVAAVSLRKPNSIVAAATRMGRRMPGSPMRIVHEEATAEAWRQYDICGELHFATTWLSNSVGRCRITINELDSNGRIGPETKDEEILSLFGGLLQNPGMQNEYLVNGTKNLTVAGDGWTLGESNPQTGLFDQWCFLSTREVSIGLDGNAIVKDENGNPRTISLADNLLLRTHRPHPDYWQRADSPTKAALPILRELEELSKYLFATINSRLAGAGILGMPSEMSFPDPKTELQPGETPFMAVLAEGMLTPIEDMGNVAALVPIVIQAPRDALAGIQWITNPNGKLDTVIAALREAAIRRLALSLDLSPDTLFGSGNSSRWGQWTIEEQSIKFHIEPVMIILCSALTVGWLNSTLEAMELIKPGGKRYVFWYDAVDLIQRPDQGARALDMYDRGELSGDALRRETGFQPGDAPTGAEKEVRALLKVITTAPQVIDQLLPALLDALGLGHIEIVPITPPDGTPPQPGAPKPNSDSRPMPAPKKPRSNGPKQDQTPGEPTSGEGQ